MGTGCFGPWVNWDELLDFTVDWGRGMGTNPPTPFPLTAIRDLPLGITAMCCSTGEGEGRAEPDWFEWETGGTYSEGEFPPLKEEKTLFCFPM